MKRSVVISIAMLLFSAAVLHADVVVLRDGKSYSGTYTGAPGGKLVFKGTSGIQYSFPMSQVETIVFSNLADHISLRSGQMYSGQWIGVTRISFRGANGIGYVFPVKDVASLVLTQSQPYNSAPAGAAASAYMQQPSYSQPPPGGVPAPGGMQVAPAPSQATGRFSNYAAGAPVPNTGVQALVIPSGTQISVRTDSAIDTRKDAVGQLYPARIQQDVVVSTGAVGIPAGTPAELQVVDLGQNNNYQGNNYQSGNNNQNAKELALSLYSVTLNGREYRVDSSSVAANGKAGYGLNKRTAEYTGGGAALGALMGAIFGGGKGAGIGTLAGGGLGAVTQYLTRGRQVVVPAESVLTFQINQTMVLHP